MVQRDSDGLSLFFIDSTGQKQIASYTNWSDYSAFEETMQAQADAPDDNARAQSAYLGQVGMYNGSADNGVQPVGGIPVKPLQKVVGDPVRNPDGSWSPGVVTGIPFSPPLPDVHPVVGAAAVSKGIQAGVVSTTPSDIDLLNLVLKGMAVQTALLNRIVAKLGA